MRYPVLTLKRLKTLKKRNIMLTVHAIKHSQTFIEQMSVPHDDENNLDQPESRCWNASKIGLILEGAKSLPVP
jgi:hypothetical protein